MSYPVRHSLAPASIQDSAAAAFDRARADAKRMQSSEPAPEFTVSETSAASVAAAALLRGVDGMAQCDSAARSLSAAAPSDTPTEAPSTQPAGTGRHNRLVEVVIEEVRRQSKSQSYIPWRPSEEIVALFKNCNGAEAAAEFSAALKQLVFAVLKYKLKGNRASSDLNDHLNEILRPMSAAAIHQFALEMLRRADGEASTSHKNCAIVSAGCATLSADIFKTICSTDRSETGWYRTYGDALRKILHDTPCPRGAAGFRKHVLQILIEEAPSTDLWIAQLMAVMTDPRPQSMPVDQALALRKTIIWHGTDDEPEGALFSLLRAHAVPVSGLDRSFALAIRSCAYRFRADLRLKKAEHWIALRAFTHASEEALAPDLHDERMPQVIALCEALTDKCERDVLQKMIDETAGLALPSTDGAILRAQTLEARSLVIANLMVTESGKPLAGFLTAGLPADAPARADALELRAAVGRELGILIGASQKGDLLVSRGAYDLGFAGLPSAERRMLRANLCDALFAYDKTGCGHALVLELTRLNKSRAPLEHRLDYCADLLHIDAFEAMPNVEWNTRAFDEMLVAFGEISDAVTRATRLLDLARAAGASLSPTLLKHMRDALQGSVLAASTRSADSKGEGLAVSDHSAKSSVRAPIRAVNFDDVTKMVFRSLSPAEKIDFCIARTRADSALGTRAEQLSRVFEKLYLADDALLGTSAASRASFQHQLDAIARHEALTYSEKDSIVAGLRLLRVEYNAVD